MLCVLILYISGGTCSLKSTPITRNIFHISFRWSYVTWGLKHGLTSNKPTIYSLDYGEFVYLLLLCSSKPCLSVNIWTIKSSTALRVLFKSVPHWVCGSFMKRVTNKSPLIAHNLLIIEFLAHFHLRYSFRYFEQLFAFSVSYRTL